jgi:putative flippase GtrA
MPMMAGLHRRIAALVPELAKFGLVGGIGAVIDLGGAAYLHLEMGIGPMVAKGVSITAATVVTYLGSRFWTFRHRVNQAMLREGVLFAVLNVIGLVIAEAVIAFTHYGLGMTSALAYNAASVAGTGLGTIFRYFSYKKWVFLAAEPATAAAPARVPVSTGPGGGRHAARHGNGSRPGGVRHPAPGPARHAAPRPAALPSYQDRHDPAYADRYNPAYADQYEPARPNRYDPAYQDRYDPFYPGRRGPSAPAHREQHGSRYPDGYGPFQERLDPAPATDPF